MKSRDASPSVVTTPQSDDSGFLRSPHATATVPSIGFSASINEPNIFPPNDEPIFSIFLVKSLVMVIAATNCAFAPTLFTVVRSIFDDGRRYLAGSPSRFMTVSEPPHLPLSKSRLNDMADAFSKSIPATRFIVEKSPIGRPCFAIAFISPQPTMSEVMVAILCEKPFCMKLWLSPSVA